MTNPVRQLQLSLSMDPREVSDRLAMTTLQRWYQRAAELNGDSEEFDFFKLRLHKNIYLSGLFLCLLDPKLVKFFAGHLQSDCLNADFLHQALERHQLLPMQTQASSMMEEAKASGEESFREMSDALTSRIMDQISTLFGAHNEPQTGNEQNSLLLAQIRTLTQQSQEQGRLLQEQAHLLERLTRGGLMPPAEGAQLASAQVPLHDLSATAAKVRKVREKGVF